MFTDAHCESPLVCGGLQSRSGWVVTKYKTDSLEHHLHKTFSGKEAISVLSTQYCVTVSWHCGHENVVVIRRGWPRVQLAAARVAVHPILLGCP